MKRSAFIVMSVCCLLLVSTMLAQAQIVRTEPVDAATWLPAEIDGAFVVPMGDPDETARALNILLFFGTLLQPERIQFTTRLPLDDLFPLELLDVEGEVWADHIAPWVRGSMVIGYGAAGQGRDDVVYILPTDDAFATASSLAPLLQDQDFLQSDTYRDIRMYQGDRATLAFAPEALILGSDATVRAVLDVRAGEAPGLASDARFTAIRDGTAASLPDGGTLFYLQDDGAADALPLLLDSEPEAADLLAAMAQTAVGFTGDAGPTGALLSGAIDAVGVRLRPDLNLVRDLRVSVMVHLTEPTADSESPAAPANDLLAYIPRAAVMVGQGDDTATALAGAFAALPAANFAPLLLAAFPVGQTPGSQGLLPLPDGATLQSAAIGMADALADAGVSITDVLALFDGPYTAALIARPNDPTPVLNSRVDVLFAASVSDGPAAIAALTDAIDLIVGDALFTDEMVEGVETRTIAVDGEPVIRLGLDGDILLAGTGRAVDRALQAQRGDNQLIAQPRWELVSGPLGLETAPNVYVDLAAFYSVFQPGPGGASPVEFATLGMASRTAGEGFYAIDIVMHLEQ